MDARKPDVWAPGSKVAIALSGGGSRAMAFHLGCLTALHGAGILDRTAVISAVSGGSVLAALYCHCPGGFAEFEAKTREILARGLVRPALHAALTTTEGIRALSNLVPIAADRCAAAVVRPVSRMLRPRANEMKGWLQESPLRRRASRTTSLRRALGKLFEGRKLSERRADRPRLIVVACAWETKSAFYFAKDGVGSWRFGRADPAGVEIAHAVAASAAYPALLPALDEDMVFEKDGKVTSRRVVLTDGGVYDNLGLAPLWPDRDPGVSLHADRYARIVACRAGYALEHAPPGVFWPSRMHAAFDSVFARAQNLAMKRLFDLQRSGCIEGFVIPYLDQNDGKLAVPPDGLVTRDMVTGYPTDFSAMESVWVDKLAKRGEQLTRALLAEHWRLSSAP